ncbi:MAG: hypothetical protein IPK97_01265 [Ahniella sp.]|nr:hypothetical protein [Ahniella sp.]
MTRLITCLLMFLVATPLAAQQTFYVATNGVDAGGNGTNAQPWATITFALDNVPDNSLILVKPGTYTGRIRIRGNFAQGVTVRSEVPYQARLRAAEAVLTIYNDNANIEGISIEGFDIAHTGAGAGALVVQIQDGFNRETRRITLRDNILHDSFNNDILKINNGASDIQVLGNVFYNQTGSDEHIDINSVDNVLVAGNVFFNNFAASGRSNPGNTASFVVVKDSNASDDEYLGARNVVLRGNVFLNWEGSTGNGFILFGEDGTANFEAFDCVAENNLLIGNSANMMRSPLGVKGSRDITFRHNTLVGNLPANAFVTRINREVDNPQIEAVRFVHNVFSDPTGTMADFSDTLPADLSLARPSNLLRNLYWNNGQALPFDGTDVLNISGDATRLEANPLLADPAAITTPHWLPGSNQFNGGFARIADAFRSLAETYGIPSAGSLMLGAATNASDSPGTDLLGRPRTPGSAAIGCCERDAGQLFGNGFE